MSLRVAPRWAIVPQYIDQFRIVVSICRCLPQEISAIARPWRVAAGVFDCKPLQFLWSKFGEHYSKENTVMLDDLRRNYIMNKQNGLVIYPFQKAFKNGATDRELVKLKYYFKAIARRETLSELTTRNGKST